MIAIGLIGGAITAAGLAVCVLLEVWMEGRK